MCKGEGRSNDRSHLFVYLPTPKMSKLVSVPVNQNLIDAIRSDRRSNLSIDWTIIPNAGDLVCLESIEPSDIADPSSYLYLYVMKMVASQYKGLHEAESGYANITFKVIENLADIEL